MNCPNPQCEGTIQNAMVPKGGKCSHCKLNCIQCSNSGKKRTCEEWNVATAKFCRGCGQEFLKHWLECIEDYFKGDEFFHSYSKKLENINLEINKTNTTIEKLEKSHDLSYSIDGKSVSLDNYKHILSTRLEALRSSLQGDLYETVDLDDESQPGFILYNTGNFLFFLSSDGRLFPIPSKNTFYHISTNSKYRDWKASCVDSYIVLYCSKQWRLIAQNSLSIISNLSSLENPNPSCQWEALSPEVTILPNQKPLIWDIPGKYTLVAWVTISSINLGFELHQRIITHQGTQFQELSIIQLADFTDENFFCWEKSPYTEDPKAIVACKKGLFEIDFSSIKEGMQDQVKLLPGLPQKSWWIDEFLKDWNPDLLLPAFLLRLDPQEILIGINSLSPESTHEVVGIDPMTRNITTSRNITTYGAKNAPGKPICLKGKRGFFTLNKTDIHECSYLSHSRSIFSDDINNRCLGALNTGDLFFYWGSFFDGSKSLRKLEIKSLSNSHPRFSFPALTGAFISNPVVSFDGIWYLEISKNNQLKIWLLNTAPNNSFLNA